MGSQLLAAVPWDELFCRGLRLAVWVPVCNCLRSSPRQTAMQRYPLSHLRVVCRASLHRTPSSSTIRTSGAFSPASSSDRMRRSLWGAGLPLGVHLGLQVHAWDRPVPLK